jgi:hypothetical protein
VLDVTDARERMERDGSVLLRSQAGVSTLFEVSGYVKLGAHVVACVATWRGGGMSVECATYISKGDQWNEWSGGGVDYLEAITEYDDLGGIAIVVGMCGDIGEYEGRYVVGAAGWAAKGVEVTLEAEYAETFRVAFTDSDINYFAVPIIGSSPDGQDCEVRANFRCV